MELLDFFHPKTVDEVKSLLYTNPKSKILAGGTDLVLKLRKNKVNCDYIVSLDKVYELKKIAEYEDRIEIGPMVTFNDLLGSEIIQNKYNSLINCSKTMGSPQIRNVATVGGNIVNAGSAADLIPCIITMGGVLVIESYMKIRKVSCEEYFKNYSEENLKEDEILTKVVIPKDTYNTGFYKLGKRNSLAIARVSVAINIKVENQLVTDIKICLGAVGRYPFRINELENQCRNKDIKWLFSDEALKYLEKAVEESTYGRKTMPFKREAVKGIFKEVVTQLYERS